MKKILMIVVLVSSAALVTGCGFSNCGYSSCTSCCNNDTIGCCGSSGWY